MFKDEYRKTFSQVTASRETYERIMNMTEKKQNRRTGSIAGKILLAAVLIMGLVMSVSAAEAVQNWFVRYFSDVNPEDLSESQVEYLEEHTQTEKSPTADAQTMVQLDSFLTDGQIVYVTLNLTLSEQMESPGAGWTMDQLVFTDGWYCPADQERATLEQRIAASFTSKLLKNGEGNTCTMVLSFSSRDGSAVFTPGSVWKIHLDGLEAVWRNLENEHYLYEEKYAGQDVMLDGEELASIIRWETVCENSFEFILDIPSAEQPELELITTPLTLTGTRAATTDELMENPQIPDVGPVEARLVSFKLSPLTYYIEYDALDEQAADTFNPGSYFLKMKDGREIEMFPYHDRQRFQEPIILEEAEYVLCPDGTKLPVT